MYNAKETINYLKKSPVFASSLGSKELFHSNIWAYLINQNPRFLNVFFDGKLDSNDFDELEKRKTEIANREKLNMDLLVVTKNKVFVIENKIKSLPKLKQLEKYQDVIAKKFNKIKTENSFFLLTGIGEKAPSFLTDSGWNFLNYNKIADGIRKKLQDCKEENYYSFANEYCDVIENLSSLLNIGIEEIKGKYYFLKYTNQINKELLEGIDQLGVGDVFQKMNADRFVQHVQKNICDKFAVTPICQSGYSHHNSLAEFFFEKKKGPVKDKDIDQYVRIGVQIQEAQFRWFIATRTKTRIDSKKVYEKGLSDDLKWFFKREGNEPILCPSGDKRSTSMRRSKEYCLFHTSTDTFVYQYIDIDEDECGFDVLTNKVRAFMTAAEGKNEAIGAFLLERQ